MARGLMGFAPGWRVGAMLRTLFARVSARIAAASSGDSSRTVKPAMRGAVRAGTAK